LYRAANIQYFSICNSNCSVHLFASYLFSIASIFFRILLWFLRLLDHPVCWLIPNLHNLQLVVPQIQPFDWTLYICGSEKNNAIIDWICFYLLKNVSVNLPMSHVLIFASPAPINIRESIGFDELFVCLCANCTNNLWILPIIPFIRGCEETNWSIWSHL